MMCGDIVLQKNLDPGVQLRRTVLVVLLLVIVSRLFVGERALWDLVDSKDWLLKKRK